MNDIYDFLNCENPYWIESERKYISAGYEWQNEERIHRFGMEKKEEILTFIFSMIFTGEFVIDVKFQDEKMILETNMSDDGIIRKITISSV